MSVSSGSDVSQILDKVAELLNKYIVFSSQEELWTVVAWIAHCHYLDAFDTTPRLFLMSSDPQCGKTRVLELIDLLAPNPLNTFNISTSALFRITASGQATTILMDEADTYLGIHTAKKHEDHRALLNAGNRRNAKATRARQTQSDVKVETFTPFAPVALAAIHKLPSTIMDRSIVIVMKRRAPGDHVESFRYRLVEPVAADLRETLAETADRTWEEVRDRVPETRMPEGIVDRAADVWEPLVAIGDYAGEPWTTRLRNAAVTLEGQRPDDDVSMGVRLLAHCREVFENSGQDRLRSSALAEVLNEREDWPWGSSHGEGIDPRKIARLLKPYGIGSAQMRFGKDDGSGKGYKRSDFEDAWNRYCPRAP